MSKCKMCGRCCRLSTTIMPEEDWSAEIEELLVLKGKQYVDTIARPYGLSPVRRYVSVSVCPHLDLITDKCRIQGHKPAMCRMYPVNQLDILPGCGYE